MKKSSLIFTMLLVSVFLLMSLPLASSFNFRDFVRWVGKATAPANITISVGNSVPVSGNLSTIAAQSINEYPTGVKYVTFSFTATDGNGVDDLDTAQANFSMKGEITARENLSCKKEANIDTNTANYSCIIGFWYWDAAGNWNVSFSATDSQGASFTNGTQQIQLQETTGIAMSPGNITWPSIGAGNTNKTSDNDPVIINNTANKNISMNNVNITAVDLAGLINPAYKIYAANFTADIETGGSCSGAVCIECDGTALVNGTSMNITSSILTRGNLTAGSGVENLYLCLPKIGTNLTAQTYSTVQTEAWSVNVG